MPTIALTWLERLVAFNKWLCERFEGRFLPLPFVRSLLVEHAQIAGAHLGRRAGQVVLDLGGGHLSPFLEGRRAGDGNSIYAVDILPQQIAGNRLVDGGVVADLCRPLPFADASVDLVVTRSVLEHLERPERFFAELARILKPGGRCIHVFPGRNAPFALVNRALPHGIARRLVHGLFPEWRDEVGFRAFYRDCSHPAMLDRHRVAGLPPVQVEYRYFQAGYLAWAFPLFLPMVCYDLLLWRLDLRRLASQILLVCEKPPQAEAAWTAGTEAAAAVPPRSTASCARNIAS